MKKLIKFICCVFAATILLNACKNNTEAVKEMSGMNADSAKATIAARNTVYSNAVAKNDSATFVNCYTDSCCLYAPNMPEICGKAGVGKFFSMMQQMGTKGLMLTTKDVFCGKDIMSETGVYDIQVAGGKSVDKGKYIIVWKQENNQWKMHRDIFNSDMPPMPPMASK